jgi:dienelactone hydrolase
MRNPLTVAVSLAAAAGLAAVGVAAPAAPTPEPIDIAQGDSVLKAVVFKPDGAGPFPAVVGMHGCAGLFDRSGVVESRYSEWAQHLTKAGFVVLYPDSYGSRGLGPQCTVGHRSIRTDRERVADANAARHWLQNQSYVAPGRIMLLGWSNGGISVLWTVRRRGAVKDAAADFRSAVALYPGCHRLDNAAWSARVPTLILIGAADDWTSAQACQHMVAGARGRSAGTSIVVYPAAYHDFDHPNRPLQVRSGYAFSTDSAGRIHSGTNPAARADAFARVPQWLAR